MDLKDYPGQGYDRYIINILKNFKFQPKWTQSALIFANNIKTFDFKSSVYKAVGRSMHKVEDKFKVTNFI
jgi:hypothetical protein